MNQFNNEIKTLFKEAFVELIRELKTERFLRIEEVCKMTGISERSVHNLVKEDSFPRPRMISVGIRRWLHSEMVDWMRTCATTKQDFEALQERRAAR